MTSVPPHPDIAALVAELAEDDAEARLMGRALELLAFAPEPLEPQPALRDQVLARLQDARRDPWFVVRGDYFARAAEIDWQLLAEGIEIKRLYRDDAGARVTLVRMAPNLVFPEHAHDGIEDLFLLEGEAWVGDVPMRAGDYCRAEAGTTHSDVRSGTRGAYALVISR